MTTGHTTIDRFPERVPTDQKIQMFSTARIHLWKREKSRRNQLFVVKVVKVGSHWIPMVKNREGRWMRPKNNVNLNVNVGFLLNTVNCFIYYCMGIFLFFLYRKPEEYGENMVILFRILRTFGELAHNNHLLTGMIK